MIPLLLLRVCLVYSWETKLIVRGLNEVINC